MSILIGRYAGIRLKEILHGYLVLQISDDAGTLYSVRLNVVPIGGKPIQYAFRDDLPNSRLPILYSQVMKENDFQLIQGMEIAEKIVELAEESTKVVVRGTLNPYTHTVSDVHLNRGDIAWIQYPALPSDGLIGFIKEYTQIWLFIKFPSQVLQ